MLQCFFQLGKDLQENSRTMLKEKNYQGIGLLELGKIVVVLWSGVFVVDANDVLENMVVSRLLRCQSYNN